MSFSVRLELSQPLPTGVQLREYDPHLDNIGSILDDLCEHATRLECAEFHVSGFGQARWPVDVQTDLAVVLEQLPDAIAALESGEDAALDFYEQGIERRVDLRCVEGDLEATCTSGTRWKPSPRSLVLPLSDVLEMLRNVRDTFLRLVGSMAPGVTGHPWMEAWKVGPRGPAGPGSRSSA